MAKVFISYKRNVQADKPFTRALLNYIERRRFNIEGHRGVFPKPCNSYLPVLLVSPNCRAFKFFRYHNYRINSSWYTFIRVLSLVSNPEGIPDESERC